MRSTLMCLLLTAPAAASTIYVSGAAAPGGNGTSWLSPYADLQAALAVAVSGDEIRVGKGVYKPGPAGGARTATFAVPSGVAVRGGFAGPGGPNPDERNIGLYVTTLSGDLNGNDGANFTGYADNCLHVVTLNSASLLTFVEGFTIRGAFTGGVSLPGPGAGVSINGGRPNIVDCIITANDGQGAAGGGMALVNSFGTITRCTFLANRCQSFGGGLHISGSGPTVTDCVFDSNIGGSGAGVFSTNGSDGTFTRCTFKNNRGQIGSSSGPGFYENASTSTFNFCTFLRNTTGGGGGGIMSMGASFTQVRNCAFIANQGTADGGGAIYVIGQPNHMILTNCLFSGNRSDLASGTTLFSGVGALVDLTNCTIVNSGLGAGTGTISGNTGNTRLYNCILWNNANNQGSGQGAQFFGAAPTTIDHCTVQGWTGSLGGAGNSGAAPLFADLDGSDNIAGNEDDNATLLPGSPCIDAAANGFISGIFTTDLLGNPRFHDDPGTPDTGSGGAPIADRGCYEFQGATCYANCDLSMTAPVLTANDFQCFLNQFASNQSYANCDGSTTAPVLTANDFQCFLNAFAAGCM